MQDIRQHPEIAPRDPTNIPISCALEGCSAVFAYADGWKVNAGISMPGDRRIGSYAPVCEHVCCSLEHAVQAISTCLREHVDHDAHRPGA